MNIVSWQIIRSIFRSGESVSLVHGMSNVRTGGARFTIAEALGNESTPTLLKQSDKIGNE